MADIDLSAPPKDLTVAQGATLEIPFAVKRNKSPFNLTGYTARMQVRKTYADTNILINLNLANGRIVWQDQIGGTFKVYLQEADTASATNTKIKFTSDSPDELASVYDVEVVSPTGYVYKVARGAFVIERESTR